MKKLYSIYLMIILLMALTYLFFKPFYSQEGWPPYASEITAAILGALFTTLITSLLLEKQTEAEEIKEKNIGVYKNKYDVYKNFINTFNDIIKDNDYINDDKRKEIIKCACSVYLVATTKQALNSLYEFMFFLNNNTVLYEDEMNKEQLKKWIKIYNDHYNKNVNFTCNDLKTMRNEIKDTIPSIGTVMCSLRYDLSYSGQDEILIGNKDDEVLLQKIDSLLK